MKTKLNRGVIVKSNNGRKVLLPLYQFDKGVYECMGEMMKLAKKAKRKLRFAVEDETYVGVWF